MWENHLEFLQEKIQQLRSALFFNTSNAVLKLPTSIITALKVDDEGQVWFFINRPEQFLEVFDPAFPARLDFFRKGKQFYLQLTGKAFIVSDPVELGNMVHLSEEVRDKALSHLVLMKFKILNAAYFDRDLQPNRLVNKMKSYMTKILGNSRQQPEAADVQLRPTF